MRVAAATRPGISYQPESAAPIRVVRLDANNKRWLPNGGQRFLLPFAHEGWPVCWNQTNSGRAIQRPFVETGFPREKQLVLL